MPDEVDFSDMDEEEDEEDETGETERAPRKGRRLIPILAVVVALVVVGSVAAYLITANGIPTAAFSYVSTDLRLSVSAANSTDPDGDALNFSWSWGDNAAGGYGVAAVHNYGAQGTYTVTLTVRDSRGAAVTAPKSVVIRILPTPLFLARQAGMTATFDATASLGSPNHSLTSYAWSFGDGGTGAGAKASHTYASPGRYTVSLNVTDDAGLSNVATRYVSANTTTVDVLGSQFFTAGCPYQAYWYLRHNTYGDVVLNPNVPCTDYYPWILYATGARAQNPSWPYTLWRVDMIATNSLGYSVSNPVYLPVFNASVAPAVDSYIDMNLTFNYLNKDSNLSDPLNINYWDTTPWAINPKYSDGYGYLLRGNITMDLTESQRIFGVQGSTPAQAQSWWYNNTALGRSAGPLEVKMGQWLSALGNGKYYTYNAFQWQYEADITDLNATVGADGTTTVQVFWDGWGYDVLFDRMSYWGEQNYSLAVNAPYGRYPPRGWMPFETCWCENVSVQATIRSSLDMHYQGTSAYWFSAIGNPGPDGILNTTDDLPGWSWSPSLMDYVPPAGSGLLGASTFPDSELKWYETSTNFITSAGSYGYGTRYEYMVTPDRWNMSLGNTLTLVMPTFRVPWFDPVKSHWDPAKLIGDYVTFLSNMTLRMVTPSSGYWLWDARGRVLSMAAPAGFRWPDSGLPLNSEPYIEFRPESSG
jgi:chitodextrinase